MLILPLNGSRYFSTKSSWSTADIAARASVVVPSDLAVLGTNWISPVAPLALFLMPGEKVSPVSNAIADIRWLGSQPRSLEIPITFDLNAPLTFLPHAISGIFILPRLHCYGLPLTMIG